MANNNVLIVCTDKITNLQPYQNYFKIGVERGCLALLNNFNQIDLACADFDSVSELEYNQIKTVAKELYHYPAEKDYLDAELAVQAAIKLNPHQIILVADGPRFDMDLACLWLIINYNLIFLNEHNYAYQLQSGENVIPLREGFRYFSIIAYEQAIITIKDCKYNVTDFRLSLLSPNAISNELLGHPGTVVVNSGKVLIIYSK
ncbi:thiamine pyrophosphokinase [Spiroplasma syrphidicola EA-1]|uniref:Thiamine diphosphokinase n=1 Tax=Spiroplasma syrphidicola EA-1 TaxID=1276229 RepID=R4U4I5_9MOLU|nr:thiamine diphosphokinase [Spiroplasma syrphidicola]AGM26397.1 thiamine pyrophosphokinase [Spiroplasma syrphidicola EA-1]